MSNTATSAIENFSLIQGDSSDIWYFKSPDMSDLSVNWTAKYRIMDGPGGIVTQFGDLILSDGSDGYPANSRFVFQITPAMSQALTNGTTYYVVIEVKNTTINYNKEVARFKLTIKQQWFV